MLIPSAFYQPLQTRHRKRRHSPLIVLESGLPCRVLILRKPKCRSKAIDHRSWRVEMNSCGTPAQMVAIMSSFAKPVPQRYLIGKGVRMACHSTSRLAQPCSESLHRLGCSVPHLALQSQLVDEADEARNQDRKRQYGVFCSIPAEPLDRTAEIRREEVHREQSSHDYHSRMPAFPVLKTWNTLRRLAPNEQSISVEFLGLPASHISQSAAKSICGLSRLPYAQGTLRQDTACGKGSRGFCLTPPCHSVHNLAV